MSSTSEVAFLPPPPLLRGIRPRRRRWRFRRRAPWAAGIALAITLVLLAGAVGGGLEASGEALASAAAAIENAVDTLGLYTIEAAERSLTNGAGPAGGDSLNCTVSGVTLSGECGAATPIPPSPTSPGSKPAPPVLFWKSVDQPAARTQMSIAYDARDLFVVAFGGWNGSAYFGDTWEYLHGKWIALNPSVSPSPRADAGMVYDKKDGVVVLFGGHGPSGFLGDTWEFSGDAWTRVAVPDSGATPSPRDGAAMVYDLRDGYVLLFGGRNAAGSLSDTWKFLAGTWTSFLPYPSGSSGKTPARSSSGGGDPAQGLNQTGTPVGRADASITFDTHDSMVVLFGGVNISGGVTRYLNDTWGYWLGGWAALTLPYAPPARSQANFVYDQQDNDTVLFGGANLNSHTQFGDTWTFVGGVWTQVRTVPSPTPREGAAGVWDLADNDFVVFSGVEGGFPVVNPDTWNYVHESWTVDHASPQETWPGPAALYAASMAYDAADGVNHAILFGGMTGEFGPNDETWSYLNNNWTELYSPVSPPARSFASMVYDSSAKDVLLFGGLSATGTALGDTWEFTDISNVSTWTQLDPNPSPPARYGAAMAYETVDNYTVLYGGVGASGEDLGDTWIFSGGSWSELNPSPNPGPRAFAEATYNESKIAVDGFLLLYGGLRGTSVLLGDTWKFENGTWANVTPSKLNPPARWGAVFSYSPANGVVLLFGGCLNATNPVLMQCNQTSNASWRFTQDSWGLSSAVEVYGAPPGVVESEFSKDISPGFQGAANQPLLVVQSGLLVQPGSPLTNQRWQFSGSWSPWLPLVYPSAREGAEAQYAGFRGTVDIDKIVMFGGYGPLPGGGLGYLNDTWEWDTYEWFPVAHPLISPSPRAFGALAWDANASQVVYFGGYGPTGQGGNGYLGDTWAFTGGPSTGSWHRIVTTNSPPPMDNESMTDDAAAGYLVLFGGQDGSTVYNQTWIYVGSHNKLGNFTGNWTRIDFTIHPPARAAASMIYSYAERYVVLFGGYDPATAQVFNDTWEFKADGWTQLNPSRSPSPRFGAAFVDDHWDANDSRKNSTRPDVAAVLFGGESAPGVYLNDTWGYYNGSWVPLPNSGTPAPYATAFAMIGDDETDGNVEMFGGTNGYPMADFWTFF